MKGEKKHRWAKLEKIKDFFKVYRMKVIFNTMLRNSLSLIGGQHFFIISITFIRLI